jgi:putative MATE family efflux protein
MSASSTSDPARDRLLHGPLAWTVLRFGAPLAAAMVLQVVFNLVDQYIIARLPPALSDASLDALGICDMVAALGTIMSYGVSSATATLVAQARGRGDRREVAEIAWGSVGLVTVLGLAFGLVAVLGADVIVHGLLGAKGLVRTLAAGYLRVIVGGVVTVFVMFQVTAVQRAMGQSRLPLAIFAAGNVLNLFLAVLLVYGDGPAPAVFAWGPPIAAALHLPRWGVVGAAWATVIARAVVMVAPLLLLRRSLGVAAHEVPFLPSRAVLRRIVALAWPTSTQFTVRIGAVLLVIALVHHFFTTPGNSDAGTAYALCLRMETLALFVSMGWGGAAQTLVGTNIGAGQIDRARRAAWITGAYNVATMLLFAALFIGEGERFLRFFTSQDAIVRRAQDYLRLVGPSYAAFGFAIVLGNALVGAGATRLALKVDLVLVVAVQLPLMLIVTAALHLPPTGLWAAVVAVNVVSAAVYAVVARRGSSWHAPAA